PVFCNVTLRWPSKQDWNSVKTCIGIDLCQAIKGFLEVIVITVNKDKHFMLFSQTGRLRRWRNRFAKRSVGQDSLINCCKAYAGIRRARRPFDVAKLVIGRNGDREFGKVERVCALCREHIL